MSVLLRQGAPSFRLSTKVEMLRKSVDLNASVQNNSVKNKSMTKVKKQQK